MIINLNALSKFVDISGIHVDDILLKLNSIGLETESNFNLREELSGIVIAKIIETNPHPNADKLQVCKVFDGQQEYQIVCGAQNARTGICVAMAKIGAYIRGADFEIKKSKIRGVESYGMLCSLKELGLGEENQGIWESLDNIELGQDFANYLGVDDTFIEIALTPNKGDCASILGVARELSVAFNREFNPPSIKNLNSTFTSQKTVKGLDKMSFYGIEIQGLKNKLSPDWLKSILHIYGCKSNSMVVDVLNYVMYIYGQPMHSYDCDKIDGGLLLNYSESDFEGLDGNKYKTDSKTLLVSDHKKPVCIAGVIGGENSKTEISTNNILLEAACFKKEIVAYTSQKLNCKTQSSFRFERGIDSLMAKPALSVAAEMIMELCQGECSFFIEDVKQEAQKIIDVDVQEINNIIGEVIDEQFIFSTLEKLGFVKTGNSQYLIPTHRHDVSNNADLAEEIGRFYGYDNIKSQPSLSFINLNRVYSNEEKNYKKLMKAKTLLASSGFNEQVNFAFIESELVKKFNLSIKEDMFLLNSHSSVMNYMRPSLIIGLLSNANNNISVDTKLFSAFESGLCFEGVKEEGQKFHISGVRTGFYKENAFSEVQKNVLLMIKKDVIHLLSSVYGLHESKIEIKQQEISYAHPYNSFGIFLKNTLIAQFGEIHPQILSDNFKNIRNAVAFFEIFTDFIPSVSGQTYINNKIQAVVREFAFIVDENIVFDDFRKIVVKTCRQKHKLFLNEVYQGEKIQSGKKSMLLELTIYPDVIMEKSDIDKIQNDIIELTFEEIGGVIRDGLQAK